MHHKFNYQAIKTHHSHFASQRSIQEKRVEAEDVVGPSKIQDPVLGPECPEYNFKVCVSVLNVFSNVRTQQGKYLHTKIVS
jgi:hypothetical protein